MSGSIWVSTHLILVAEAKTSSLSVVLPEKVTPPVITPPVLVIIATGIRVELGLLFIANPVVETGVTICQSGVNLVETFTDTSLPGGRTSPEGSAPLE